MRMPDYDTDSEAEKQVVRDLDGVLPENVDRRKFLLGTIGTAAGGLLAGCTGDGGGGDDGGTPANGDDGDEDGQQQLIKDIRWRQPWRRTMSWSAAFIAQFQGMFTDQDISSPNVEPGFGSPDTARRVGTGQAQVGHADMGSAVAALAQGQNFTMVGLSRQKTILGLTWRSDLLDSPQDLEGENVALATPFAEATWPVVPQVLGLDPEAVSTTYADSGVEVGLFTGEEVTAAWGGMNGQSAIHRQIESDDLDMEAETRAFNTFENVAGYPWFVNTDWLENESDSVEYISRLLSGYSRGIKFTVTQPEEAIRIMKEDINPSLAAQPQEALLDRQKINIGINLNQFIQDGGGFLDWNQAEFENGMEVFGNALVDNPDDIPAYADAVDRDPIENADLVGLSSDEWDAAVEFAQPIWGWFEA